MDGRLKATFISPIKTPIKNQRATHHPHGSTSGFDFFSSNGERERGIQEENRRCASPDERENRNIFVLRSALTAARPLPHCQRHAIEMGLIGFFFVCFCFVLISLVYEKDCIFWFHCIFCMCFAQIVFCCS